MQIGGTSNDGRNRMGVMPSRRGGAMARYENAAPISFNQGVQLNNIQQNKSIPKEFSTGVWNGPVESE